jgi:hypothetical protein
MQGQAFPVLLPLLFDLQVLYALPPNRRPQWQWLALVSRQDDAFIGDLTEQQRLLLYLDLISIVRLNEHRCLNIGQSDADVFHYWSDSCFSRLVVLTTGRSLHNRPSQDRRARLYPLANGCAPWRKNLAVAWCWLGDTLASLRSQAPPLPGMMTPLHLESFHHHSSQQLAVWLALPQ